MKRVVIHAGYPKAASTSLQNGLFLELHKENVINFLGRAWESGFFGIKTTKVEYKSWLKEVIKGKTYRENSLGDLSSGSINLLSEGLFMMNERHYDRIISPELLQNYFAPEVDRIDILLIIRKQEELIPSYYLQNYRKQAEKSFEEYLAKNIDRDWSGEARIFNFYSVVKAYVNIFGKENVQVVLFEDFLRNRGRFSAALAKSLNIDADLVQANLGESHLNKTRKEADTLVVRKFDKNSLRSKMFRQMEKFSPSLADLLRIRLPAVAEEQKELIREAFASSNRQFAEAFPTHAQAMQEYGYF